MYAIRSYYEPEITQEILTAVRNEVGNLPPTAQNSYNFV